MNRFNLEWKVGYTSDPSDPPVQSVPASVPGAVQLDWARAEGWPNVWLDGDVGRYAWMEKVYWIYKADLPPVDLDAGKRLYFVSEGVDYRFLIRLDGTTVHGQEGMFSRVEIDLTDLANKGSCLEVVIFPVPDSGLGEGACEACGSMKPAASYGWSNHPRLVSSGIWRDTFLEIRREEHIADWVVDCEVPEDLASGRIEVALTFSRPVSGVLEWSVTGPDGEMVDGEVQNLANDSNAYVSCEVHDPALWWPRGYGEQDLYTLVVAYHDDAGALLDKRARRIGFRRLRLLGDSDCGGVGMALQVNGERIFGKGAVWMSPELFPGVVGSDTVDPLLEAFAAANLNLLRCWGGFAVGKPSFYETCDRLGILVWQDFPFASGASDASAAFLDTLEREAQSIVARLKQHPCVALWCGGDIDFAATASGAKRLARDQLKESRLLNKVCYELDPETPFLSHPPEGLPRGWVPRFRDEAGRECFGRFREEEIGACLSFALPSPAAASRLEELFGEASPCPPRPDASWRLRHGFGTNGEADAWLDLPVMEHYFGRPESFSELVAAGRLLQAEGLRSIFEETRRRNAACGFAVVWSLNEPWPAAAGPSLLAWPCEPKPALRAVRSACRETLASARVTRFAWRAGELFEAELWILHDGLASAKGDRVEAYLRFGDEELFALGWYFETLEPASNRMGPVLRHEIPETQEQTFELLLRVEGRPDWNSCYTFCLRE